MTYKQQQIVTNNVKVSGAVQYYYTGFGGDMDTIRDAAMEDLLLDLQNKITPFLAISEYKDISTGIITYKYECNIAPPDLIAVIVADKYVLNTIPFTKKEIDSALQDKFPEKFV